MAIKQTSLISTQLGTWYSAELNTKLAPDATGITPAMLNIVFSELYNSIVDINDSAYNKGSGINITDIIGLSTALGSKQAYDATILKQGNVINSLTSTATNFPVSAAKAKELKDLIDALPNLNDATFLARGTASEVTASALRSHLDSTSIHFTQSQIDHNSILNRGNFSHADIDAHINDTDKHYAQSAIDHNSIQNRGAHTHVDIDAHLDNALNPHGVTLLQAITAGGHSIAKGTIYVSNGNAIVPLDIASDGRVLKTNSSVSLGLEWSADAGESNILEPRGSGTSLYIGKAGSNLQIRTLVSNYAPLTINNSGDDTVFDLNVGSVDHDTLLNSGSITHAQLDVHYGNTLNPHSVTLMQAVSASALATTKGIIYVGTGAGISTIGVGTDGQVLKAASGEATGLVWADESSTGEANTASNFSTSGVGVFDSKLNTDLRFRRLLSTTSVLDISLVGNIVEFNVLIGNIDHDGLTNAGSYTHTQIDAHINDISNNPHNVSAADIGVAPGATANPQQGVITSALPAIVQATSFVPNYTIPAVTNSSPYGFATAEAGETLISVVKNMQLRINDLEARLQAANIIT